MSSVRTLYGITRSAVYTVDLSTGAWNNGQFFTGMASGYQAINITADKLKKLYIIAVPTWSGTESLPPVTSSPTLVYDLDPTNGELTFERELLVPQDSALSPVMGLSYNIADGSFYCVNPREPAEAGLLNTYRIVNIFSPSADILGASFSGSGPNRRFTFYDPHSLLLRGFDQNSDEETLYINTINPSTGSWALGDAFLLAPTSPVHVNNVAYSAYDGNVYWVNYPSNDASLARTYKAPYNMLATNQTALGLTEITDLPVAVAMVEDYITVSRSSNTPNAGVGATIELTYVFTNTYQSDLLIENFSDLNQPNSPILFVPSNNPPWFGFAPGFNVTITQGEIVFTGTLPANTSGSVTVFADCVQPGTLSETNSSNALYRLDPSGANQIILESLVPYETVEIVALCVHSKTKVLTTEGFKFISEIRSGDICIDSDFKTYPVEAVLKSGTTNRFIQLSQNCFGENCPSEDLLIMGRHPILVKGVEVLPSDLINNTTIFKTTVDQPCEIYSLITPRRSFVNMQGVAVGTWAADAFDNFSLNDVRGQYMRENLLQLQ